MDTLYIKIYDGKEMAWKTSLYSEVILCLLSSAKVKKEPSKKQKFETINRLIIIIYLGYNKTVKKIVQLVPFFKIQFDNVTALSGMFNFVL